MSDKNSAFHGEANFIIILSREEDITVDVWVQRVVWIDIIQQPNMKGILTGLKDGSSTTDLYVHFADIYLCRLMSSREDLNLTDFEFQMCNALVC